MEAVEGMDGRDEPTAAAWLAYSALAVALALSFGLAAVALLALVAATALTSAGVSGLGVFLFLLVLVLPAGAALAVVPGSVAAVRVVGRRAPIERPIRSALVVAGLITLGVLTAVLVYWAGESTSARPAPGWARPAGVVVMIAMPLFATAVMWAVWSGGRRHVAALAAALWVALTMAATGPAVLLVLAPYRNLTLATIPQAELDERGWELVDVIDRGPDTVTLVFEIPVEGASAREEVTVRFGALAADLVCIGREGCQEAGATAAGRQTRWYQTCDSGTADVLVPRPELVVDAETGAWLIQQPSSGLACHEQYAGLTVDQLVAVADLLQPAASPDAFWEWTEQVGP